MSKYTRSAGHRSRFCFPIPVKRLPGTFVRISRTERRTVRVRGSGVRFSAVSPACKRRARAMTRRDVTRVPLHRGPGKGPRGFLYPWPYTVERGEVARIRAPETSETGDVTRACAYRKQLNSVGRTDVSGLPKI